MFLTFVILFIDRKYITLLKYFFVLGERLIPFPNSPKVRFCYLSFFSLPRSTDGGFFYALFKISSTLAVSPIIVIIARIYPLSFL